MSEPVLIGSIDQLVMGVRDSQGRIFGKALLNLGVGWPVEWQRLGTIQPNTSPDPTHWHSLTFTDSRPDSLQTSTQFMTRLWDSHALFWYFLIPKINRCPQLHPKLAGHLWLLPVQDCPGQRSCWWLEAGLEDPELFVQVQQPEDTWPHANFGMSLARSGQSGMISWVRYSQIGSASNSELDHVGILRFRGWVAARYQLGIIVTGLIKDWQTCRLELSPRRTLLTPDMVESTFSFLMDRRECTWNLNAMPAKRQSLWWGSGCN